MLRLSLLPCPAYPTMLEWSAIIPAGGCPICESVSNDYTTSHAATDKQATSTKLLAAYLNDKGACVPGNPVSTRAVL